jgi:hypothetical protein
MYFFSETEERTNKCNYGARNLNLHLPKILVGGGEGQKSKYLLFRGVHIHVHILWGDFERKVDKGVGSFGQVLGIHAVQC